MVAMISGVGLAVHDCTTSASRSSSGMPTTEQMTVSLSSATNCPVSGRHGGLEGLRENDEPEGLEGAEPEGARRLKLPMPHGADARTQDFAEKRAVVQGEGQDAGYHQRQVDADERRAVVDKGHQHDGGQGTEHIHVHLDEPGS